VSDRACGGTVPDREPAEYPKPGQQECVVVLHHREADALLALLEQALNKQLDPGIGLRRDDAEAAGVKIELARQGIAL
jgi:hypothetical protein